MTHLSDMMIALLRVQRALPADLLARFEPFEEAAMRHAVKQDMKVIEAGQEPGFSRRVPLALEEAGR